MSSPDNSCPCCRNDSRTVRLIRFLSLAKRQFFFAIAMPSRASPILLCRQSTVNNLSRLRVAPSNTRPYAAASSSRLRLGNRLLLSLSLNPDVLPVVVITAGWVVRWVRYGVNLARPFARRRLSTSRPAFVAIRARKPWVRARFIVLGWNVRFITGYLGRKPAKNSRFFRRSARLLRWFRSVNRRM